MKSGKTAFTLVELMVLMAMTAILTALLIPAMTRAREQARLVTCQSNLKQIGIALGMYQADYDDFFPSSNNVNSWPMYRDGWGLNHAANPDMYPDIYYVHPYQILAYYGYLKVRWRDNRDRVKNSVLVCPADRAALREVRDPANAAQCRRAHVLGGLTVSYNCNYLLTMNMWSVFRDFSSNMMWPAQTMLSMDYDWWNDDAGWPAMMCIRPWGRSSPSCRDNARAALARHGGEGSNVLWADFHVSFENAFAWNSGRAFSQKKPDGGIYTSYHAAQRFYWPLGYYD